MHVLYSPCTRRMGLHQRHIGMTGIMNGLALYSLMHTVHWTAPNPFSMHKIKPFHLSLVKCRNSLFDLHSLLSLFLHQCLMFMLAVKEKGPTYVAIDI